MATTREALGQPWLRAAIILGVVAAVCWLTGWLWLRADSKYGRPGEALTVPLLVIGLTATLLGVVLVMVPAEAILFERFLRGAGWLQVLWVAIDGGRHAILWIRRTVTRTTFSFKPVRWVKNVPS